MWLLFAFPWIALFNCGLRYPELILMGSSSEISPRATLGRDDKEGVVISSVVERSALPLGSSKKSLLTTTYLSLYRLRNSSSQTQSRLRFPIASCLGMLYTSGWLLLFVNSPSVKCSESFAFAFNWTFPYYTMKRLKQQREPQQQWGVRYVWSSWLSLLLLLYLACKGSKKKRIIQRIKENNFVAVTR